MNARRLASGRRWREGRVSLARAPRGIAAAGAWGAVGARLHSLPRRCVAVDRRVAGGRAGPARWRSCSARAPPGPSSWPRGVTGGTRRASSSGAGRATAPLGRPPRRDSRVPPWGAQAPCRPAGRCWRRGDPLVRARPGRPLPAAGHLRPGARPEPGALPRPGRPRLRRGDARPTAHVVSEPTWGRLGDRVRPVPGNHEYRTPGRRLLRVLTASGRADGRRGAGTASTSALARRRAQPERQVTGTCARDRQR